MNLFPATSTSGPSRPDLLINRDRKKKLTLTDGIAAAIIDHAHVFVTSLNSTTIPEPPLGAQRNVYRRADATYGPDDYICWPQPFNPKYPFLAAIPRCPRTSKDPYYDDGIMWATVAGESDMVFSAVGEVSRQGVLKERILFLVDETVVRSRPRIESFKASIKNTPLLTLFVTNERTFSVALDTLRNVASPVSTITRGWCELRRAWLYLIAMIDYYLMFEPRFLGAQAPPEKVEHRMGCFVWDTALVDSFAKAGLPVFLVQEWRAFDRQNIFETVEVIPLREPNVCTAPSVPHYPVIYCGQAGSDDKFAAIASHAYNCFTGENPFANTHYVGKYESSYQSGPVSSPMTSAPSASSSGPTRNSRSTARGGRGRTQKSNASQSTNQPHALLESLLELPDSPYTPPPIPSWNGANALINRYHPDHRPPTHAKESIVPFPNLFLTVENTARQHAYFHQWAYLKPAWFSYCRSRNQRPVGAAIWKKMLAMGTERVWDEGQVAISAKQIIGRDAFRLAKEVNAAYSPGRALFYKTSLEFDAALGRALLWELCEINFWQELRNLDREMDITRPQPSPTISNADLALAVTAHSQERDFLIRACFNMAENPFAVISQKANMGFASDSWVDRYETLKAFWKVMDSWKGTKPTSWRHGIEFDYTRLHGAGAEWERMLVVYYCQIFYNVYDRGPVHPRRH